MKKINIILLFAISIFFIPTVNADKGVEIFGNEGRNLSKPNNNQECSTENKVASYANKAYLDACTQSGTESSRCRTLEAKYIRLAKVADECFNKKSGKAHTSPTHPVKTK